MPASVTTGKPNGKPGKPNGKPNSTIDPTISTPHLSHSPPVHPATFIEPPPDIINELTVNREAYLAGDNPVWINITSLPIYIQTCGRRLAAKVFQTTERDPGLGRVFACCLHNGVAQLSTDEVIVNLIKNRNRLFLLDNVPAMLIDEVNTLLSRWKVSIPNYAMGGFCRQNFNVSPELGTNVYDLARQLDININVLSSMCIIWALADQRGLLAEHKAAIRDTYKQFRAKCSIATLLSSTLLSFIETYNVSNVRATKRNRYKRKVAH